VFDHKVAIWMLHAHVLDSIAPHSFIAEVSQVPVVRVAGLETALADAFVYLPTFCAPCRKFRTFQPAWSGLCPHLLDRGSGDRLRASLERRFALDHFSLPA